MTRSVTFRSVRSAVPVLLLLLLSCTSDEHSVRLLRQADSLLHARPDSALELLRQIPVRRLARTDRARHALLTASATNKCGRSLFPCDSLLDAALRHYKQPSPERARTLLYKGRLEAEMNQSETAIGLFLEAWKILQAYPEETEMKRHVLSSLGNEYHDNCDYEEAFKVYQSLFKYCTTDKDKAIALDGMSSCHSMISPIDSAYQYQRKAISYATVSGDSAITAMTLYNFSLLWKEGGKADSALYYARHAILSLPKDNLNPTYHTHLAELLIGTPGNNRDSIVSYLTGQLSKLSALQRLPVLQSLYYQEIETRKYKEATRYIDEFMDIMDSVYATSRESALEQIVHRYNAQFELRKEEIRNQKERFIIIIASLVVCFVIATVYQHRINKKRRAEQAFHQSLQQAQERIAALHTQIHDNQSMLTFLQQKCNEFGIEERDKKKAIQEKEATINQLQKEISEQRKWLFTQSNIYRKVMSLAQQEKQNKREKKTLNTSEQEKLRRCITEIYSEYIANMHRQYPKLTNDDLLLLCLQEAQLPSVAIALCFGYSDTHTINQRKYRIKERMNMKV